MPAHGLGTFGSNWQLSQGCLNAPSIVPTKIGPLTNVRSSARSTKSFTSSTRTKPNRLDPTKPVSCPTDRHGAGSTIRSTPLVAIERTAKGQFHIVVKRAQISQEQLERNRMSLSNTHARRQIGFTLIELLVVIAIIALTIGAISAEASAGSFGLVPLSLSGSDARPHGRTSAFSSQVQKDFDSRAPMVCHGTIGDSQPETTDARRESNPG
jgi:prepilin-type N-terminal cleavage/methylation domain-containing protein